MSEQASEETRPWVLISGYNSDTKGADLERITPQIRELIDEWQSQNRVMWSGALDDNETGMAVFEATKREADLFYEKYGRICSGILNHSLYQWDAMPILSFLS